MKPKIYLLAIDKLEVCFNYEINNYLKIKKITKGN